VFPKSPKLLAKWNTQMTASSPGPHPVDRHVGRRIKLRRRLLKLSQRDLCRQTGLSTRGLQGLENGRESATTRVLYDLGGALGVPLMFFFEGLPASSDQRRSGQDEGGRASRDLDWVAVANDLERIADPRARRKVRELVAAIADAIATAP